MVSELKGRKLASKEASSKSSNHLRIMADTETIKQVISQVVIELAKDVVLTVTEINETCRGPIQTMACQEQKRPQGQDQTEPPSGSWCLITEPNTSIQSYKNSK